MYIINLTVIDHLLIGEASWVNLVVVDVWLPLVQGLVIISLSPKILPPAIPHDYSIHKLNQKHPGGNNI